MIRRSNETEPNANANATPSENKVTKGFRVPTYIQKARIPSVSLRELLEVKPARPLLHKLGKEETEGTCSKGSFRRSCSRTPMGTSQSNGGFGRFCKRWTAAPEDGVLTLEVADTGCGIAEVDIPRLFQPFSQANKAVHGKFGGTGLGLWLCDKLIKAMKGTIGVTSVLNKGTTFTITLPAKAKQQPLENPVS